MKKTKYVQRECVCVDGGKRIKTKQWEACVTDRQRRSANI